MGLKNFLCIVFALLLLIGCSSSGNPTQPIDTNNDSVSSLPIGVSTRFIDGSPSGGFGVMGLFELNVDSKELSAEINSIRTGSLTDTLEVVDITNFLALAPCTDCIDIRSVELNSDGNLVVSIGIKHPFEAGDPLKPISGRNRGDLHVFNIEGIIAAQDSASIEFPLLGGTIATSKLLNATGYTPYLDSVLDSDVLLTDANLHSYILHFADYTAGNFDPLNTMGFDSVTEPPPSGNLVMAMGCDYDYQDYVFLPDESNMSFIYAIGCTYGVSSASKSERFTPEYRIPQHLKKAASEVHVIPPTELLTESDPSVEITLQIEIVDPSHAVSVGEGLDEMLADSSVSTVAIEIPYVLTSTHSQPGSSAVSGTGLDPTDPLLFEFTFSNEGSVTEGIYPGLVKVSDSYLPGNNESPLLDGMDGIKRVDPVENPLVGLFNLQEFATYATFEVEVELGYVGTDPVPDITRSIPYCVPATVDFDASGSTDAEDDPLSIPLNFEFDFDYDGVNFDIDRAMSTDPTASSVYPTRGCYTTAVRVTDSDLNSVIGTVDFAVGDFIPGDPESDITDGSITDIYFQHGQTFNSGDVNWPGSSMVITKGLARGDGYNYVVFRGGVSSLYFARSDDDGATWATPVQVKSSFSLWGGCSITADETGQVVIVWTDRSTNELSLEYSSDNGDTFSSNQVVSANRHNPDVALDPTNGNNIVVYAQSGSFSNLHSWIYYSSAGPGGIFSEVMYIAGVYGTGSVDNIYNTNIHYAIDGDAYFIAGENNANIITRSSDNGATWPDDAAHRSFHAFYGYTREMDSAMDPTDPDVFYITRVERNPWNPRYPVRLYRATDGLHPTQIQNNVNDNNASYVYKFNPSITVNAAGVVYLSWITNESGDWDIMMDYSCDLGITFGTDVVFNTVDNNDEIDPHVIPNLCGDGVICVWEQNGHNSNGKLVSRQG